MSAVVDDAVKEAAAGLPFVEHLPLIAGAPGGIKRLRGLILELAVRGKLVPQDPGEEPAAELLDAIGESRRRLVREREKRDPAIPARPGAHRPYDLPLGWAEASLQDLGIFVSGKTPSKARPEFWDGDIPWVTPKDMKSLDVTGSEDRVTRAAIEEGLALIPPDSVFVVVRSGILRRTVPVAVSRCACTVNQDLKALLLARTDLANYVRLIVRGFERFILGSLTKVGTTVESIKFEEFATQPFPLPPLAEQQRILAKVDELMALCNRLEAQQADAEAAHATLVKTLLDTLTQSQSAADFTANWQRLSAHFDTLFTTEASIDALKQTLLELAVRGKLVPQDPEEEPARELLLRISEEQKASGAKGKPRPASEPMPVDQPLPASWCLTRLGDLVLRSEAGWSPNCEQRPASENEWGVLKVSAVSWGEFRPQENKLLPANLSPRPELEVQRGDFLLSRANTAELVARSVVVESTRPRLLLSDKIIRLHLSTFVNRRYCHLVNISLSARAYYAAVAGGTSSSMKNVSRQQILNLAVPLPPLAEQHRIVAKLDELMALCDRLEAQQAEARALRARLSAVLTEQAA